MYQKFQIECHFSGVYTEHQICNKIALYSLLEFENNLRNW